MASQIVTNIKRQVRRLGLLIDSINHSALDIIEKQVSLIKARMEQPGAAPTYPIHWDSEKQRKKVMAMLREENNLPYRRTNAYIEGWISERSDQGVSLRHAGPAAAIGGFYSGWQSSIHAGRWPNFTQVVDDVMADVPQKIQDQIYKEATATLRSD